MATWQDQGREPNLPTMTIRECHGAIRAGSQRIATVWYLAACVKERETKRSRTTFWPFFGPGDPFSVRIPKNRPQKCLKTGGAGNSGGFCKVCQQSFQFCGIITGLGLTHPATPGNNLLVFTQVPKTRWGTHPRRVSLFPPIKSFWMATLAHQ